MSPQQIIQKHLRDYFALSADEKVEKKQYSFVKSALDDPYTNPVNIFSSASNQDSTSIINEAYQFYQSQQRKHFALYAYDHNALTFEHLPPHHQEPTFTGLLGDVNTIADVAVANNDIRCEMVTSTADLAKWITPFQTAFGYTDHNAQKLIERYSQHLTGDHLFHFIAYIDNTPVGSASLFFNDNVWGLYNLGVLPEYRQQGVGTALLKTRIDYVKSQQGQQIVLHAAPITTHMTEKMSFKKITSITPLIFEVSA